ncbi:MAG: hypothetical protein LUC88_07275 [Prevotella sp.]|nr:hypothetical protein [Prevotella sp.]
MNFTDRMGIEVPESPITVRYEAPTGFRIYLLQLMLQYEKLKKIRSYICFVTKEAEEPILLIIYFA